MRKYFFSVISFLLSLISLAQAPSIISFTPKSQIPGAFDTIFGNNFHTIAANNLVQFGTAKANVVFANSNMLVVTVPFGSKMDYISVIRTTDSLRAYSNEKFIPTFNSLPTSYFEISNCAKRKQQSQVVIGDLNLDGKPDIVTIDSMGIRIRIYQNRNISGQLNPDSFVLVGILATGMSTGGWASLIKLADLNGDGKAEILLNDIQTLSSNLRVFKNNVTAGANILASNFSVVNIYSNSTYTVQNFDVNDLNGDGKADIALMTRQGLQILRNNVIAGNITISSFPSSAILTSTTNYSDERGVKIGDLDNDGKNDIVITHSTNYQVQVVKNNAAINSLMPATDFSAFVNLNVNVGGNNKPNWVDLADMDLDGKLDIVAGNRISIMIFKNISVPGTLDLTSFANRIDITETNYFFRFLIEDINGDRKPDLILSDGSLYGVIQFLENRIVNGILNECSFIKTKSISSPGGGTWEGMDLADLNMDGLPDMVVVQFTDSLMCFYKGIVEYRPTISSVTPNFGSPGDTVSILGKNFETNPALIKVFFGNASAQVVSASTQLIRVIIPIDATPNYIRLLANNTMSYSPIQYVPVCRSEGGVFYRQRVDLNVTQKNPFSIMAADLNNDHKPEIITLNRDSNSISIFRNVSTQGTLNATSFSAPFNLKTNSVPDELLLEDFDRDGKNDILVNYYSANTFSIFKNNYTSGTLSAASFAAPITFSRSLNGTNKMISRDFDTDGKPDLINLDGTFISYVFNNTLPGVIDSSAFATYGFATWNTGSAFNTIDAGDLDGDNKPEVICSYNACGKISIYKNSMTNYPDAGIDGMLPLMDIPYTCVDRVMIADMDMDGRNDIIVLNYYVDTITVFKNISTNGCLMPSAFQRFDFNLGNGWGEKMYLSDVNSDRKPDLVFEDFGDMNNEVLRAYMNTSTGTGINFKLQNFTGLAYAAVCSYICDLDGDSLPDIMSGNAYSPSINSISFYKGEAISSIPIINNFVPLRSAPGLADTINGNFFSPVPLNNIVKFGAVRATVIISTKNRIIVRIPAGASHDRISVTVNGSTVYSGKKFLPVYSDTGATFVASLFTQTPQSNTVSSGNINSIEYDDIDMDDKPDLITLNTSDFLQVYKNNNPSFSPVSATSFGSVVTFSSAGINQLEAMDMNGDGKRDLCSFSSSSTIRVLNNTATQGVINNSSFNTTSLSYTNIVSKSLGDQDGDGKTDLILKNTSNSIDEYKNTNLVSGGAITFDSKDYNPNTMCYNSYTSGALKQFDLDGDNKPELIGTCSGSPSTIRVMRYHNLPGFLDAYPTEDFSLTTDTTPDILLYGDLDNDNKNDIITVCRATRTLCLHKNIYDGITFSTNSFAPKVSITASATLTPLSAETGDIDGDGRIDLAIGFTNGSISLYRNISVGGILSASSFAAPLNISTPLTGIYSIRIQDINSDGIPEITVAGSASGIAKVHVISVAPIIQAPTLSSGGLNFSNITAASVRVNWTSGNGTQRLVIASLSNVLVNPSNNKSYQPQALFGSGDTIGNAQNFAVYRGAGNSFTLTGLSPFTTYYFKVVEFNGNGISTVYQINTPLTGSTATLPVTLLNFTVKTCNQKCAELNWQTASEINNSHFEIQRSFNSKEWEIIGSVKGNRNSKMIQNYQYVDLLENLNSPINDRVFYRLKQVDFDGEFEWSPIRELDFGELQNELKLYPNPFEDELRLEAGNSQKFQVNLYNSMGTKVYSNLHVNGDDLDLSLLYPGVFLLHLIDEQGSVVYQEKFIKK